MNARETHDALVRTAVLLDDGDTRFLQTFGLNRTQYAALQLLDQQEGTRLVDLAAVLLVERSTITRVIDHLEQAGRVQRLADAADRRSQRVVLTAKGANLRAQVTRLYDESLGRRMGVLSAAEQRQLVELLQRLQGGLAAELPVGGST